MVTSGGKGLNMSPTPNVASDSLFVPFESLSRDAGHHDIHVRIGASDAHPSLHDPLIIGVARKLLLRLSLEMPMTRTALLTAALMLLATACEGQQDCTTEARGSVNVSIVDADGSPTDDFDSITYDSSSFDDDCERWETGEYVCGWEIEGTIDITLSACDGAQTVTETVTVESDVCHVIPVALELQLDPCDAPAI